MYHVPIYMYMRERSGYIGFLINARHQNWPSSLTPHPHFFFWGGGRGVDRKHEKARNVKFTASKWQNSAGKFFGSAVSKTLCFA